MAGAIAVLASASLVTHAPATPAAAQQTERTPITVTLEEHLGFGVVVGPRAGSGRVWLESTGNVVHTEQVTLLDGTPTRARFRVEGEPDAVFRVELPGRLDLPATRGRLVLADLTACPSQPLAACPTPIGRFDPAGHAVVHVGGTIEIEAGGRGSARAVFPLRVDYEF